MWRRWIIFIGMIMCCTVAHARVLHVGDDTMQLYETKNTTPALNVKIDDEMWYGNLTRCPTTMNATSDKYLRIQQGDADYYAVSDLPADHSANYNIIDYGTSDGKLTDVNGEVYLASTGTQYIDTEYIPTLVTRTEIDLRFSDDTFHPTATSTGIMGVMDKSTYAVYEVNFGGLASQATSLFPWLCDYPKGPSRNTVISWTQKTTRQTMVLDGKNKTFKYGTTANSLAAQVPQIAPDYSMTLFGYRRIGTDGTISVSTYSANDFMYIYDVKIYEDDTLVRHLVPVPCGLKIGDYTVPRNGMWDIVEQKFYGNSGTGEFLYGSDE